MSQKECGVLLAISSLPGKYGIGTLGENAFKFIDFLSETGFSYWEILPIEDIGGGNSPYDIPSAFSLNYLLIDFDELIKDGLLTSRDFTGINFTQSPRKVNYASLKIIKENLLKIAFRRFNKEDKEFLEFKNNNYRFQYALFRTIKSLNNNNSWYNFRLEDRYYSEEIKEEYTKKHADLIDYYLFLSFIFIKQWDKLHAYAKSKHIDIIGEVPHFLSYNSDAMYMSPELFLIDKRNIPTYVVGFPPDYFRKDGQKWGYPLYDWEYMELNNYKWRKYRLNLSKSFFDRTKLNHFRGFVEVYAVPFRSKNAKKGIYLKGPGIKFIEDIKSNLNLIANDAGMYSEKVDNFVKESGLPGLRIFFRNMFDTKFYKEELLPSNISENVYLYLGDHDNNTIKGTYETLDPEMIKLGDQRIKEEAHKLGVEVIEGASLFEKSRLAIEVALASKANHVTLMMSDILFQGKEARMNVPGTVNEENWTYRFLWSDLTTHLKNSIKEILVKYNRSAK